MSCKIRLDLIKAISMAVLQDLKMKADSAFKEMNDWLGARFLKEMERSDADDSVAADGAFTARTQIIIIIIIIMRHF